MSKLKAIITIGVSASGKTTFAEAWRDAQSASDRRTIICRDETRVRIFKGKMGTTRFSWKLWNWKWETGVTKINDDSILYAVANKSSICIADTNLDIKRLNALTEKLKGLGFEVEHKYFDILYEEAVKRDAQREVSVGAIVIGKQFAQLRAHKEAYFPADTLPTAVICDIDGTLAHMNGKRGPHDLSKVHLDDVDVDVRQILDTYHFESEIAVILLSGRDSVCQEATLNWLNTNRVKFDQLFMRTQGDIRSDTIVKRELFDEHIRDKYNVRLVLDDRPKVCRMWRDLGLKVLQCGDPHMEF